MNAKELNLERRRPTTLARWFYALNTWKWPMDCPEPPEAPDEGKRVGFSNTRRRALIEAIKSELGTRELRKMNYGRGLK